MNTEVQLREAVPVRLPDHRGLRWFFVFFFVSGFCSILYEIIWLRLAMASFGVTTALVSIVISVFMAGLGLGSWASGRFLRARETKIPGLRLYALTELLIGISALLVPHLLLWGRALLEHLGINSSLPYYLASGLWIAIALIPWCACMGATIPVAMLAIGQSFRESAGRSFSFLYVANVLGAMLGAILPLLVIELYGFRATLRLGAVLNFLLAGSALLLSSKIGLADATRQTSSTPLRPPLTTGGSRLLVLLFITGFTSMGMEVVWIRQFTPYLGNAVYTFASILALYLASTFVGSRIYRVRSSQSGRQARPLWILLGIFAMLPLLTADPQLRFPKLLVTLGIVPFSAALGFITPMLVDRWSQGDPDKAGSAYAVNVLGCILGPLVSGFLLLPFIGERWVLFVLAIPFLAVSMNLDWWLGSDPLGATPKKLVRYAPIPLCFALVLMAQDYDVRFPGAKVLRDSTATVMAVQIPTLGKRLLVNGVGMTELSTITKIMAHLPLASLDHAPQNGLVICFGMGTAYRSLLSWGISGTAVELVPSVPKLFGYFHPDGPQLLQSPLSHLVIDDGRRYLERTSDQYDIITLDPPPPVQSAGSSMLYSVEFYSAAKQRLRTDGILQQWLPGGDAVVRAAVARALLQSFPYVRSFHSANFISLKLGGTYFLASNQPIQMRAGVELAARMPQSAIADLMEWSHGSSAAAVLDTVVQNEFAPQEFAADAVETSALHDDKPVNEYYVLRKSSGHAKP
ncbi:MAG TPA: hypothetical protein VFB28_03435 [Terriglobales bacterium]|nr:hypothetical protein [Terriglobales bacterium]